MNYKFLFVLFVLISLLPFALSASTGQSCFWEGCTDGSICDWSNNLSHGFRTCRTPTLSEQISGFLNAFSLSNLLCAPLGIFGFLCGLVLPIISALLAGFLIAVAGTLIIRTPVLALPFFVIGAIIGFILWGLISVFWWIILIIIAIVVYLLFRYTDVFG